MSERDLADSRVRSYLANGVILLMASGLLFFLIFGSGGVLARLGNFFSFLACVMLALVLAEHILGLERPHRDVRYPY